METRCKRASQAIIERKNQKREDGCRPRITQCRFCLAGFGLATRSHQACYFSEDQARTVKVVCQNLSLGWGKKLLQIECLGVNATHLGRFASSLDCWTWMADSSTRAGGRARYVVGSNAAPTPTHRCAADVCEIQHLLLRVAILSTVGVTFAAVCLLFVQRFQPVSRTAHSHFSGPSSQPALPLPHPHTTVALCSLRDGD
ncbi:hypothetical protein DL89DRAFT_5180 [Linderina pennispora]|uniref:Uncharacterized protein n=1 Tax=Linderina pennispora TaxID=61395 RepID=A0A1Y1WK00_9FUNG|nr:uncharacterized protein DL89DRAFT_5180 [Linderina pennispora]ORX73869.1 hypothetical protein DL89DRAFT_5180 [Linderina pennispora]